MSGRSTLIEMLAARLGGGARTAATETRAPELRSVLAERMQWPNFGAAPEIAMLETPELTAPSLRSALAETRGGPLAMRPDAGQSGLGQSRIGMEGSHRYVQVTDRSGKKHAFDILDGENDTTYIDYPELPVSARGQKLGVAAYEAAIADATQRGRTFVSGPAISPSAMRVYEALERRGYRVERLDPAALSVERFGEMTRGFFGNERGSKPLIRVRAPSANGRPIKSNQPGPHDGGHIEYTPAGDVWRIHGTAIDGPLQNQGLGTRLYQELIERAAQAGAREVRSGGHVTPEAQRVYAALERRGYRVTKRNGETGTPVFTISTEVRPAPDAPNAGPTLRGLRDRRQ